MSGAVARRPKRHHDVVLTTVAGAIGGGGGAGFIAQLGVLHRRAMAKASCFISMSLRVNCVKYLMPPLRLGVAVLEFPYQVTEGPFSA